MKNRIDCLHQYWSESKWFRIGLIVAILYVFLRLGAHGFYLSTLLSSRDIQGAPISEWVGSEVAVIPNDLNDYLTGANNLRNRQDLYLSGPLDKVEFFQYAPSYALVFTPFLDLSPVVLVIVHTLFHLIAYGLLYWKWGEIFTDLGLEEANKALVWTLPVWLFFSAFWGDLSYLNIYIIMALLGTLFIEAVLNERFWTSLLWLSIILQTKPQWAFAIAIPLFLGRWRFFFKLSFSAVIAYFAIAGLTVLVVGPAYGIQQYQEYVQFLADMPGNFPWRGSDVPFLGYNHSVKQFVIYLAGLSSNTMRLATVIKLLLLVPLGLVSLRHLLKPVGVPGRDVPQLALDFAFALYTGAFIWLDMVWELSLGIVVFTYLVALLKNAKAKVLVWLVFLPYALVDFVQLASVAIFGMDIMAEGVYILTDFSIYIPVIMIVIVVFHLLLVNRLKNMLYMHMLQPGRVENA